MMNNLLLIFSFIALYGCNSSVANMDDVVNFKISGTALAIPKKYVLPGYPNTIVPTGKQLDSGLAISVQVPLSDLNRDSKADDEKNRNLVSTIIVLLSELSSNEVPPDTVDAWQAKGLYKTRIIDLDEKAGLYRVYPEAGYPKIWHYFISSPDKSHSANDEWVAGCTVGPLEDEKFDYSNIICKTTVSYQNIQGEVSFSAKHIKSIDDIKTTFSEMLISWDKNTE